MGGSAQLPTRSLQPCTLLHRGRRIADRQISVKNVQCAHLAVQDALGVELSEGVLWGIWFRQCSQQVQRSVSFLLQVISSGTHHCCVQHALGACFLGTSTRAVEGNIGVMSTTLQGGFLKVLSTHVIDDRSAFAGTLLASCDATVRTLLKKRAVITMDAAILRSAPAQKGGRIREVRPAICMALMRECSKSISAGFIMWGFFLPELRVQHIRDSNTVATAQVGSLIAPLGPPFHKMLAHSLSHCNI